MTVVRQYVELTYPELAALDRRRTVFLGSLGPIEVHGPHLPVGTDVFVAGEMVGRYAEALQERYPELELVELPPIYAGADPLPFPGSVAVPPRVLEGLLDALTASLAAQGFHYLIMADNHGGPRHQLAIESSARRAWRRRRFHLIDPFGFAFRAMVQHDPEFAAVTGLGPGRCGDDLDVHAGTNETSLMLAAFPGQVRPAYRDLPAAAPCARSAVRNAVGGLATLFERLGARETAADLRHLGETLAWVDDPEKRPYMGAPALATAAAGEAMYRGHVWALLRLFDEAWSGRPAFVRPMLWGVRALKSLPG